MAQLSNVNPGDLITAANWNALVAAVQGLSAQTPTGPISVPNVFGLTLGNAAAIINLPSTQLTLGSVFDTLGNTITSTLGNAATVLVLGQMPASGTNVFAGTSVNLVVSPLPGSAPPTPLLPTISAFNPVPVPVQAQLEIDGKNFDPLNSNNQVTIGGVATATPSAQSNSVTLFVIVPTGIQNAPTVAGATLSVPVVVTTPSGTVSSTTTITAPLAKPLPAITGFIPANPQGGNVNQSITIIGTGFDATPANNSVIFDVGGKPVPVVPTAATTSQLTVTIPDTIVGLTAAGGFRSVNIAVVSDSQQSAASAYNISS